MRIIVADKQNLVFEGIRALVQKLGKHSTEQTSTIPVTSYALESRDELCLIVDPDYCEGFSPALLGDFARRNPQSNTMILSNNLSNEMILACLEANVDGYINKSCSREEFSDAVLSLSQGKKAYCQPVLTLLCNQYTSNKQKKTEPEPASLTAQETKITELTSWGLTAKEIADKLNISIHTVNTHRKNIFKKIGVKNSSELVMYAVRNGIIDSTEYYI